jgi:hypothetical protein
LDIQAIEAARGRLHQDPGLLNRVIDGIKATAAMIRTGENWPSADAKLAGELRYLGALENAERLLAAEKLGREYDVLLSQKRAQDQAFSDSERRRQIEARFAPLRAAQREAWAIRTGAPLIEALDALASRSLALRIQVANRQCDQALMAVLDDADSALKSAGASIAIARREAAGRLVALERQAA